MKKERNFIVSDLHGSGNLYKNIILYLEQIQKENPDEKIILNINGDLIDRGPNSMEMLLDVIERTKGRKGKIEVNMLAGNHEELMLEAINKKKTGNWKKCNWFYGNNGGLETAKAYDKLSRYKQLEVIDFLENLPLWKIFKKNIDGDDGVILIHAAPQKNILAFNHVPKLKECNRYDDILWYRRKNENDKIGIKNYLTVIGHTVVDDNKGYEYNKNDNVLCIDGGYAYKSKEEDYFFIPVLELNPDSQNIIIHLFDENSNFYKKYNFRKKLKNNSEHNTKQQNNINERLKVFLEDLKEVYKNTRFCEQTDSIPNLVQKSSNKTNELAIDNEIICLIIIFLMTTSDFLKCHAKKLIPNKNDNMMTWVVRNRKNLAFLTLIYLLFSINNKKDEPDLKNINIERDINAELPNNILNIVEKFGIDSNEVLKKMDIFDDDMSIVKRDDDMYISYYFEFDRKFKIDDVTKYVKVDYEKLDDKVADIYETSLETLEALNPNFSEDKDGILVPDFEEIDNHKKTKIKNKLVDELISSITKK